MRAHAYRVELSRDNLRGMMRCASRASRLEVQSTGDLLEILSDDSPRRAPAVAFGARNARLIGFNVYH